MAKAKRLEQQEEREKLIMLGRGELFYTEHSREKLFLLFLLFLLGGVVFYAENGGKSFLSYLRNESSKGEPMTGWMYT